MQKAQSSYLPLGMHFHIVIHLHVCAISVTSSSCHWLLLSFHPSHICPEPYHCPWILLCLFAEDENWCFGGDCDGICWVLLLMTRLIFLFPAGSSTTSCKHNTDILPAYKGEAFAYLHIQLIWSNSSIHWESSLGHLMHFIDCWAV